MATIWDVAKLAGVSKSTASRVLNDGSSSPEARKAVLRAVKILNYQPSCFAKNIRTQKSMTIALMIPDASNLFYTEMFNAVEQVAFSQDYMVILCDTQNSSEAEINYAEKLLARKIDGLIYCTYKKTKSSSDYFTQLADRLPVVFADYAFKEFEDIAIVATEGYESSCNAVKFLYHQGRRRIGYINFPKDANVTYLRYEGYLKGLEECGLPVAPERVYFPDPERDLSSSRIGYLGAKQLLSLDPPVDAIMFAADQLAVGAMKFIKQQGVRIPQDVSLIGFDNNEICEIVEPTLTTIAQPIEQLGTQAAEILFSKIRGQAVPESHIFFEGNLIQRGST